MPVPMFIPPWLQAANPAEYYQRGLQIGASIGAQQAQQRLAEQSAVRAREESAMQQARWEAEYNLRQSEQQREAQEAAARTQARLRYRDLISNGVDPTEAMMQTPEIWGQSLAGIAQVLRAEKMQEAQQNFTPRVVRNGDYDFAETSSGHWTNVKAPQQYDYTAQPVYDEEGNDTGMVRVGRQVFRKQTSELEGYLSPAQKAEVSELKDELKQARVVLAMPRPTKVGTFQKMWDEAEADRQRIMLRLKELGVRNLNDEAMMPSPATAATPASTPQIKIKNWKVTP